MRGQGRGARVQSGGRLTGGQGARLGSALAGGARPPQLSSHSPGASSARPRLFPGAAAALSAYLVAHVAAAIVALRGHHRLDQVEHIVGGHKAQRVGQAREGGGLTVRPAHRAAGVGGMG